MFKSFQRIKFYNILFQLGKICFLSWIPYYHHFIKIYQSPHIQCVYNHHKFPNVQMNKGGGYLIPSSHFSADELEPYILFDSSQCNQHQMKYVMHTTRKNALYLARKDPGIQLCSLPLHILIQRINKSEKIKIANLHNIQNISRVNHQKLNELILDHSCSDICGQLLSVFKKHESFSSILAADNSVINNNDISMDCQENDNAMIFPPSPLSKDKLESIVNKFCDSIQPVMFEESGCAVCGQLSLTRDLTSISAMKNYFNILQRPGCNLTMHERKSNSDPIREILGPIIDYDCKGVCQKCCDCLYKRKIPHNALANGFWIGKVPEELKNLTFAEKLLISRVRHNCCIVRVFSGMYKMKSNVVCFELPMPRIYEKLPPHRDDISEVLAFIFTGMSIPGSEELKRTPMLIRRNKVADALEWLKLNHKGYFDLDISYDNLNSYSSDQSPVTIIYQEKSDEEEEEPISKSVHGHDSNEGVTNGSCPFTVSGLTGDEIINMLPQTIAMHAMRHIRENKGGVLAIGDDNQPLSIYNNPHLYTLMFPHLFPYGLGGVGNIESTTYVKISSHNHKKNLLLYHDK